MTTLQPSTKLSRWRLPALVGQMATLGLGALMSRSARAASAQVGSLDVTTADATLDDKIGQMPMVGFGGAVLNNSNPVVADIRDRHIRHIGSVLLFDSPGSAYTNIQSPRQLKKLTSDLQVLSSPAPHFIAVDQEGGNVARLKPQ